MPNLNALRIEDLIAYCKSNNIGAIIPTRDGELEFFARYKATLAENGIAVMISDYSIINACLDKLAFSELKSIRDVVIPASTDINRLMSEKFVVKERYGAGSVSIGLDLGSAAAQLHAETLENPIYQPFQAGYEISVDAYVTKNRQVKGLVMRVKVVDGESQVTSSFEDASLQKMFLNFWTNLTFMATLLCKQS